MEYSKIINFLSRFEKLTSLPFLIILRNSMLNIVPVIIAGSFSLLFFILSNQIVSNQIISNQITSNQINNSHFVFVSEFFRKMYVLTMGMISLYLSASIGYNYAKYYSKEEVSYLFVSLASFVVSVLIYQDWANVNIKEFIGSLGVKNMFSCIIISFLGCYFFSKIKFRLFKEESIPVYVLNSLNAIVPFFVVIFLAAFLGNFLKFNEMIKIVLFPFEKYGDNLVVVWITNLILHLTNFVGIHGISLINSVFLSLWQKYLVLNAEIVMNGGKAVYITAYPFFQWFVWIGGAGSTLGLNIILFFSKSSYLRAIAKSSIIPSFFNINEPLLFGLPIVLNPYFIIPFILVPIVLGTVSFSIFLLGWVDKPYIEAPWMFPSPLGAFLSTTDPKAIIMNIFCIALSALLYLPFVKIYEKKLFEQEKSIKNYENSQ
ncbi:MAG: PTS sugar transporter subunit IIC [bacterium]